MDWQQFVNVVALPAVIGAYGLGLYVLNRAEAEAARLRDKLADAEARLSSFQLEVAQKYASVAYLKDVENRLAQMVSEVKTSVEKMGDKLDRLLDRGGAE